jgi:hypothetical protein
VANLHTMNACDAERQPTSSTGTLLTDEALEPLMVANIQLMAVSFDGARRASHECIRYRANHEETINRVATAKRRWHRHFIRSQLHSHAGNFDEVQEFVALWNVGFDQTPRGVRKGTIGLCVYGRSSADADVKPALGCPGSRSIGLYYSDILCSSSPWQIVLSIH